MPHPGAVYAERIVLSVAGNPSGSLSMVSPLVLVVNAANLQDSNIINVDTVVFAGSGQTIRTTVPTGGAGSYTFHSIRVAQSAGTATMGQTLSLTNDLVVSSGTLNLGGFHIGVTGNFRTEATGALQMVLANDSLGVAGSATFGGGSTTGLLTNGIITVNGNFVQTSGTSAAAFAPSGAHRVSLRGTGAQNLNFANTTSSFFDVLEAAATGTRNIVLQSNIRTNDSLIVLGGGTATDVISAGTTQRLTVNGFLRVTQQTLSPLVRPAVLELAQFPSVDSIFAAGRGVSPDTTVFLPGVTTFPEGTPMRFKSVRVATNAVLTFSSSGGSPDSLVGDLVIDGSSTFAITSASFPLVVAGKLRTISTGVLRMQTAFTELTVADSAIFGGGSTNGQLTNGTLRLRGHFVQAGGNTAAFQATVTHVTEFNDTLNTRGITMVNPGTTATSSRFGTLRIAATNQSAVARPVGVALASNINAETVIDTSAGAIDTILGGGFTVTTNGLSLDNTIIDKAPIVVNAGQSIGGTSVLFRNMDPAVNQLTLNRLASDFGSFSGINFSTLPNAGVFILVANVTSTGTSTYTFSSASPTQPTMIGPPALYQKTGVGSSTISWNGANLP